MKACFDQMLEAPNNLACLQHRANLQYVKLHAQTQCKVRYHLKHKYGISKGFNSHSKTQPWYGMGQGAGDTSNWWVIGSDSMADAYQANTNGWTIKSPVPTKSIKFTLKAFFDNVNLFIRQDPSITNAEFHKKAQQDIDRWHGILKATGGELNTKMLLVRLSTSIWPKRPPIDLTQTTWWPQTSTHHIGWNPGNT